MITLLASIAGFITSLIPEIIKFFKDKNDKNHELDILDRQIAHTKHSKGKEIEEIIIASNMIEQASLYSTYKTGVTWVDALNGSVRPMLAYCFFLMYGSVKFIQYKAVHLAASLPEYMDAIWNLEDQAIFAGIISFYFGQRTFNKIWKK
jgi:hypothetical protein